MEALDEFHYIPVAELNRVNDYTYALGKNQMRLTDDSAEASATAGAAGATDAGTGTAGAAAGGKKSGSIVRHSEHVDGDFYRGIVGVDYMLASGDNDLYIATGDGTKPFGRITANNPYSSSTRSVEPVNDHFSADRDGNLIISFGTKEQAAGLQGIIFSGDLELPATLDDFKTVAYVGPTDENGKRLPLDDDGKIAETVAETEPETTKAAKKPAAAGITRKPGAAQAGGAAQAAVESAAESAQETDAIKAADSKKETKASTEAFSAPHSGDGNTRESAASTEAGTAASSTATTAASTTEADKPHGTIPGVIEIPSDGTHETSEGKHVLTEEERLAILESIKASEAANG